MKCPQCGSVNTERVYITDADWMAGGSQRCLECKHVGKWVTFIIAGRPVHKCPVESDPLVSWQEKCPSDDRDEAGWYILIQRDAWVQVHYCPHCGEKLENKP